MKLIACYHWFERRWLYQYAEWISQTNERRLELFHTDHPSIDPAKLKVMGNFPPRKWREGKGEWRVESGAGRVEEEGGGCGLMVDGCQLAGKASDENREADVENPRHPSPLPQGESKKLPPHPSPLSQGESKKLPPRPSPRPQGGEGERRLRLVYVGSVSLHDTFIGPLVDWILARNDDSLTLDVFAYNADEKTKEFLREASGERREARESVLATEDVPFATTESGLQTPTSGLKPHASRLTPSPRIGYFEQGVDYDRLPEVLANYDVGVILYRCNTTNYKFNASNKLFEYLACGLEVWFPPQMLGVKPYARADAFPRVMEVDFEKLDTVDLEVMRDTQGLPPAPPPPCCEDEFEKLVRVMRGG